MLKGKDNKDCGASKLSLTFPSQCLCFPLLCGKKPWVCVSASWSEPSQQSIKALGNLFSAGRSLCEKPSCKGRQRFCQMYLSPYMGHHLPQSSLSDLLLSKPHWGMFRRLSCTLYGAFFGIQNSSLFESVLS